MLILWFSALLFFIWLIQNSLTVVTVQQESMLPALKPGERFLAIRYWPVRWVKKGQIVLVSIGAGNILFVKRVVALSGETFKAAVAEINDDAQIDLIERTWHIPPKHFFVCGDNVYASTDSREWGPLPFSSLRGYILFRL
ncbi:MAG: signal peptidase I [Chloroflexota bacterium]